MIDHGTSPFLLHALYIIPVFIDTDCILPFMNIINWKDHLVWVDWDDIDNISKIILDFHRNISNNEFKSLQLKNRKLWLEKLNPSYTLNNLMLVFKKVVSVS